MKFKKEKIIFMLLLFCKIYELKCSSLTTTAFGEILVTNPLPITQILTTYGINNNYLATGTTGTGSVTTPGASENLTTISSGTTAGSSAKLNSTTRLSYQPGQGAVVIFAAIFPEAGIANTTRIIGIGNDQDGFFFGFNGTDFGILHRSSASGSTVSSWIPQGSWNGTSISGFDPSFGNVYKIQFQYLGFGAINFFIEDPNTGQFVLVHQIKYANQNTDLSLLNPSLQLMAESSTTVDQPAVTIKTGSMASFIEGDFTIAYDTRNSLNNKKLTSITSGVNQNIIVIKNNTTFQSKTNQITVYPDFLYLFNGYPGSTNVSTFSIYLNPTFNVAPTFPNSVNTNTSVVSYDTADITLTGGKLLFQIKLNNSFNYTLNLADYGIQVLPGQTLACICNTTSSAVGKSVGMTLSWKEKF